MDERVEAERDDAREVDKPRQLTEIQCFDVGDLTDIVEQHLKELSIHIHCVTLLFFRLKKLVALVIHYICIFSESTFCCLSLKVFATLEDRL